MGRADDCLHGIRQQAEENSTTVSITTGEVTYVLPFATVEMKKKWAQGLMAMERSSPRPSPKRSDQQ
jgi:hypothetical protein